MATAQNPSPAAADAPPPEGGWAGVRQHPGLPWPGPALAWTFIGVGFHWGGLSLAWFCPLLRSPRRHRFRRVIRARQDPEPVHTSSRHTPRRVRGSAAARARRRRPAAWRPRRGRAGSARSTALARWHRSGALGQQAAGWVGDDAAGAGVLPVAHQGFLAAFGAESEGGLRRRGGQVRRSFGAKQSRGAEPPGGQRRIPVIPLNRQHQRCVLLHRRLAVFENGCAHTRRHLPQAKGQKQPAPPTSMTCPRGRARSGRCSSRGSSRWSKCC